MYKYIWNIKNLILITIGFTFPNLSYGKFNEMKKSSIVFYCENKAENHRGEYNAALCIFPFLNAVLGHLISIDNNANIQPSSLESFEYDFQKNAYLLKLKKNLVFQNSSFAKKENPY